MTDAETIFWNEVRCRKFMGLKFKRQYGYGIYIYDFFIPSKSIAIEIDGKIHLKEDVKLRDKNKESFSIRNGVRIIRFTNNEVIKNIDQVLIRLYKFL